jgi:hypothetical protein
VRHVRIGDDAALDLLESPQLHLAVTVVQDGRLGEGQRFELARVGQVFGEVGDGGRRSEPEDGEAGRGRAKDQGEDDGDERRDPARGLVVVATRGAHRDDPHRVMRCGVGRRRANTSDGGHLTTIPPSG